MKNAVVLLESESPVCPVQAIVEQTEHTVYFYLFYPMKPQGENIKICWVCNRKPAPARLDPNAMRGGRGPMMPAEYVVHSQNGITPQADALEIVWFEEGESAALLEHGEPLAVIPAWGGMKNFHGYAKYAVGTGPFAWEMTGALETLSARIAQSRRFWAYTRSADFWPQTKQFHLQVLEAFYGKHTQYYAIDEFKFPPRAVIEGQKNGVVYGITAGISAFRQPQIELYVQDAAQHRRIEFGFAADAAHSAVKMQAYNCFMAIGKMLHGDMTFFAHGHTNTWKGIPDFAAFLFLNARAIRGLEAPDYPHYMGDPLNLLWAVPVTQREYDYTVQNGVDALLAHARDLSRIHIFDGTPKFAV